MTRMHLNYIVAASDFTLRKYTLPAMLLYFKNRIQGKAGFSKSELNRILTLYGERVQSGMWRDYAIDTLPDMAVFSVFRSTRDNPAYTIVKTVPRSFLKPAHYTVYDGATGDRIIRTGTELDNVLNVFREKNI